MSKKKLYDNNLPAEHMQLNEFPLMPTEANTHNGKKIYQNGMKKIRIQLNKFEITAQNAYMCVSLHNLNLSISNVYIIV